MWGLVCFVFAARIGLATTFSAVGDPYNPHPELACRPGHSLDDRHDLVVAHRTLPCGTRLTICLPRTRRCTTATVADRGPYGRSQLDLAPAVARALRHNGLEPVAYAVIR